MYLNCLCQIKARGTENGHRKDSFLSERYQKELFRKNIGTSHFIIGGMTGGLLALQLHGCQRQKQGSSNGSQKVSAVMTG